MKTAAAWTTGAGAPVVAAHRAQAVQAAAKLFMDDLRAFPWPG